MSDQYRRALRACYEGMLKHKVDESDSKLSLFCYTQDCFFGKDTWNELTKSHRGALYYQATQVNKPFDKIFNLNEQPETELDVVLRKMEDEPYQVLDKANGHLFIVSCFTDKEGEQHVVFHTKGGFPGEDNDLLNDDIKIFWSKFGEKMDEVVAMFPNSTWMFEAIVTHDKHTMYDQQVDLYGDENTFVLLGANIFYDGEEIYDPGWHEVSYSNLNELSGYIGCPVVVSYDSLEGTPDQWLDHTNREGYVIHFTETGDRVKIKTREYWAMRFKKDLNVENILALYRKSGESKIRLKLPEEVADQILEVLKEHHEEWFLEHHIQLDAPDGPVYAEVLTAIMFNESLTREERASLFKNEHLTMPQKQFIAAYYDGKDPIKGIGESKQLRIDFEDYMLKNTSDFAYLEESLMEIVDTIE